MSAIADSASGPRVLACASAGGHFKQLLDLMGRFGAAGVTWLTYDCGLTTDLMRDAGREHDRVVYAPYAAPRDAVNLARDAVVCRRLLREQRFDLAVSTGAGIALSSLPLARAHGVRSIFIESATRAEGPSMTGRLMAKVPGVELCTQNPGYGPAWRQVASVHDGFARGPDRSPRALRRLVVTVGTIAPYGFRRLIARLLEILPGDVDVLWQTGSTDLTGLPVSGAERIPAPEMTAAMREADVVVAHAGTGSALSAFEVGAVPVLVPRRHAFGEHIDDHQVTTARALVGRGLAVTAEADELSVEHLLGAATGSVVRRAIPPKLAL
jgi:UDP-N-acetylglucosamine--N-acetylmuramyl-(pentapeptide) pyrophosphoryl-undecaprenol N-acetylglucosamine transferase